MLSKSLSLMVGGALLLSALPAGAGGRAVECYERYSTPDVYDTVYENVLVNPATSRVEYVPAIYGTRKRAVVIQPASVSYEVVPARYETRYRTVKVGDGGYSWEWRVINGRNVLCKIKQKARYEQVAETVLVREVYKRKVVIPAQYGYEVEQVEIQPEQRRVIDIPATYQTVARKVLVSEGSSGWQRVHIRKHCG